MDYARIEAELTEFCNYLSENEGKLRAFVDIGVKQDGLIHVSKLADHFVRDPSEVAKVGQKLQVIVLDVDGCIRLKGSAKSIQWLVPHFTIHLFAVLHVYCVGLMLAFVM